MNNESLLVVGILGCTLVILNIIFVGIIFTTQRKMNAVKTWPTAIGNVTASYLQRRRTGSSNRSVNYPVVQYSYQVGGQLYQGSKIAPGLPVGGSGAGKVVERYPAGAQALVFYNPQDPNDAVLETKAPALWVLWLVFAITDVMLCGMAIMFAFVM